jgi:hypothetical protein
MLFQCDFCLIDAAHSKLHSEEEKKNLMRKFMMKFILPKIKKCNLSMDLTSPNVLKTFWLELNKLECFELENISCLV